MTTTEDAAGPNDPGGTRGGDVLRLERQVCLTLAVASREVVSLYRPLLEPLGLTHPQYLVMVALWESDGPRSVGQLSRMLTLEAPTLSPLLKRLERAGFVERRRDPADARSTLVGLTAYGDALRTRAADVPPAIFARIGLSSGELRSLRDALTGVIERAAAWEAPATAPAPGSAD